MCTLGTRTKVGEELFVKVDYQYPLNFANLAKEMGVKHYGLLSSTGADAKSMFLYMKTKGRVEADIREAGLNSLTIYRPGFLLNRRGDKRFGETVGAYIPFVEKIPSADMGRAMIEHAVHRVNLLDRTTLVLNNAQIIADLRTNLAKL